jgi:hypothetical protein
MQAGLVASGAVVISLVFHTVVNRQDLAASKRTLLAKQKAVQVTLGGQWLALRKRIESDTVSSAKPYAGDHVEPEARSGSFRTQPGLYLRIRLADAQSPESVARAAATARKDAVVACLLREPNEVGIRGELDGGAFAEQPWNLGAAYAATAVLSDEWTSAVEAADEPMRLRVLSAQYDKAMQSEIPLAVDIIKRARFYLLVLDEDPADAPPSLDGGPLTEGALQLVAHPARVHLFDLGSGKELFRLRLSGEGRVVQVGEHATTDRETIDAMRRQANNCALGHLAEDAIR